MTVHPLASRIQKRLGGPKEAQREQQRRESDLDYFFSHLDRWRERHPNRWVAVYLGKALFADSSDKLFDLLQSRRIPAEKALIDYVTEERVALVL